MRRHHLVISLAAAVVLVGTPCLGSDWMTLTDTKGTEIEARILAVAKDTVRIKLKKNGRDFEIPLERLSLKSQVAVSKWEQPEAPPRPAQPAGTEEGKNAPKAAPSQIPDNLPERLYPQQRDEIRAGLAEIRNRPPNDDYPPGANEGLRVLNSYRFLCGVPDEIEIDRTYTERATAAATVCEEKGTVSHEFGSHTESCAMSMGRDTLPDGVKGLIVDAGDNNRERRGHRRWCLNWKMEKTGFAFLGGKFFAMWAIDESGPNPKDSWAFPGKGLYPLEYLGINAWSLYLTEPAPPAKDLTVEVYKLAERPEKPFSATGEIDGEKVPIDYVNTYENSIQFEPKAEVVEEPGIFYVRIRGGGVREGYLVELFHLERP